MANALQKFKLTDALLGLWQTLNKQQARTQSEQKP